MISCVPEEYFLIFDVVKSKDIFKVEDWNKFTDIPRYLPHDIPGDSHGELENAYENVSLYDKYRRRFQRFFRDIESEKTLLLRFGDANQTISLSCRV
jgi:hypothetical protein